MITVHELHSQRLAKNQERLNEIEQAIIDTSNNNKTTLYLELMASDDEALIHEVLTKAGFNVDYYSKSKQLKICW